MFRLIICGYSFEETRSKLDTFLKDRVDEYINTSFIRNDVWKKGNTICLIAIGEKDVYPVILPKQVDYIRAKTPNDALLVIDSLKNGGYVKVDELPKPSQFERYPQEEALRFLKLQKENGIIKTLNLPE